MELEQIMRLVETVASSGLTEFDYEEGHLKIHLGKKSPKILQVSEKDRAADDLVISEDIHRAEKQISAEGDGTAAKEIKGTPIISPIVGVFYAASGPEAEPFVKIGDRIEVGQVIGIVEAMKLMNEIESDVSGIVTEICVEDGDGVEYGQPLIYVQK